MHAPDRFGPRRGRYPFQGSWRDGNLQEQSIRTTLPGRTHRIYSSAREHRPHAVRRTILPRTDATAARPHSVTRGRFPSSDEHFDLAEIGVADTRRQCRTFLLSGDVTRVGYESFTAPM